MFDQKRKIFNCRIVIVKKLTIFSMHLAKGTSFERNNWHFGTFCVFDADMDQRFLVRYGDLVEIIFDFLFCGEEKDKLGDWPYFVIGLGLAFAV